jgi:hypothetical protein
MIPANFPAKISCREKLFAKSLNLVGVRGFEPPATASRKQCSTRLSYTPKRKIIISDLVASFH